MLAGYVRGARRKRKTTIAAISSGEVKQ